MFKRQKIEYIMGYVREYTNMPRKFFMNIDVRKDPLIIAHLQILISLGIDANNLPEPRFSSYFDKGTIAGIEDFANFHIHKNNRIESVLLKNYDLNSLNFYSDKGINQGKKQLFK